MVERKSTEFLDRFWRKVDVRSEAECWCWNGARFAAGYGQMFVTGRTRYAHRLSFEIANGSIPPGMVVRHTCDNPCCVNPRHLLVGTNYDNIVDKMVRNRSGCSEQAKRKLSAALSGRPAKNRKEVECRGVRYESLSAASSASGVSIPTVRKWMSRGEGRIL